MAIIELTLHVTRPALEFYRALRAISGASIMQIRQRAALGKPVMRWDTDDFPLVNERINHHHAINQQLESLQKSGRAFDLHYRVSAEDEREHISFEQLAALLQSDIRYEQQPYD